MREHLSNLPCPSFSSNPWFFGKPLSQRRISLISTAGLHLRGDLPFVGMTGDYRVIPGDVKASELVMTHLSTNFDRTGFQRDWNVVFPLDRLRELAAEGLIGGLATYYYSFMGAADPAEM
jgi:D-proline reductase (dithiol) PrdB